MMLNFSYTLNTLNITKQHISAQFQEKMTPAIHLGKVTFDISIIHCPKSYVARTLQKFRRVRVGFFKSSTYILEEFDTGAASFLKSRSNIAKINSLKPRTTNT